MALERNFESLTKRRLSLVDETEKQRTLTSPPPIDTIEQRTEVVVMEGNALRRELGALQKEAESLSSSSLVVLVSAHAEDLVPHDLLLRIQKSLTIFCTTTHQLRTFDLYIATRVGMSRVTDDGIFHHHRD